MHPTASVNKNTACPFDALEDKTIVHLFHFLATQFNSLDPIRIVSKRFKRLADEVESNFSNRLLIQTVRQANLTALTLSEKLPLWKSNRYALEQSLQTRETIISPSRPSLKMPDITLSLKGASDVIRSSSKIVSSIATSPINYYKQKNDSKRYNELEAKIDTEYQRYVEACRVRAEITPKLHLLKMEEKVYSLFGKNVDLPFTNINKNIFLDHLPQEFFKKPITQCLDKNGIFFIFLRFTVKSPKKRGAHVDHIHYIFVKQKRWSVKYHSGDRLKLGVLGSALSFLFNHQAYDVNLIPFEICKKFISQVAKGKQLKANELVQSISDLRIAKK